MAVIIPTSGMDTSDATARAADILAPKTAYVDGNKVTGSIPSKAAATYTPGAADQTIASGQYLSGTQTIKGDADLVVGNIKSGVDIFGVEGTFTSDANAKAGDMLSGKTAYVDGEKVTGSIPSKAATTYNVSSSNQTIAAGQYISGAQTIRAVSTTNITSENIKAGVTVKVGDSGNTGRIKNVTGKSSVVETEDGTASAADMLSGKTAYVNGSKVTGSISSKAAATYTPGTTDQTITSGQYLSGTQTIKGDADLVSGNIKAGASIFGVEGSSSVVDTSDATATASTIRSGYTAYKNGQKITGTVTTQATKTWTPTTSDQTISSPKFITGTQTIKGDANLVPGNIKHGTTIFGVTGSAYMVDGTIVGYDNNYNKLARGDVPETTDSLGAATPVGDYALFGGGRDKWSAYVKAVNAYNTSLTRSTLTNLSVSRGGLAAASVGDYALFGGGKAPSEYSAVVDAYNKSLTRSTPTALSVGRADLAATSIGDYALFGGGDYNNGTDWYQYANRVDAYNTSLTRSTPTAMANSRESLAATSIGNYALFGGGSLYTSASQGTHYTTVDAYNKSLTRSTPTALSVGRATLGAASVGDYALFGGGYANSGPYSSAVDAYNTSLTRSTPTALSLARQDVGGASVGDYALFGGGHASSNSVDIVDAYDTSLTRSIPTPLSVARGKIPATSIGPYALFGGGSSSGKTVDAYSFAAKAIYYN